MLIIILGCTLKYGWPGATKRQLESQFYQVRDRHERDHLGRAQPTRLSGATLADSPRAVQTSSGEPLRLSAVRT